MRVNAGLTGKGAILRNLCNINTIIYNVTEYALTMLIQVTRNPSFFLPLCIILRRIHIMYI